LRLKKTISVVTQDVTGTNLASQLGIPVFASVSDEHPVSPQRRPRPEVGDVIELDSSASSSSAHTPEAEEGPVHVTRYDTSNQSPVEEKASMTERSIPTPSPTQSTGPSRTRRPQGRTKTSRRRMLGIAAILSVIALVALGWLVFLYPRATVVLSVLSEPISETVTIVVDNNINQSNGDNAHIPGQKVQTESKVTETFKATGTKDIGTKATGTVTLENRLGDPISIAQGSTLVRGDTTFITSGPASVPKATAAVDSLGNPISAGYDQWGYNYQAHMFNGLYDNYLRPEVIATEGDMLMMKWNDAWLSNKDCDGDGKLDRYYGFDSYIGSGAWLTNHMSGTYEDEAGESCHWTYFVKIVAAPADAVADGGIWYSADGVEIGPAIWGAFAIIQEVENDPCAGLNGIQYLSELTPGLGYYT